MFTNKMLLQKKADNPSGKSAYFLLYALLRVLSITKETSVN